MCSSDNDLVYWQGNYRELFDSAGVSNFFGLSCEIDLSGMMESLGNPSILDIEMRRVELGQVWLQRETLNMRVLGTPSIPPRSPTGHLIFTLFLTTLFYVLPFPSNQCL